MKKRIATKQKTHKRSDKMEVIDLKSTSIPQNELENFVGYIKNLHKIDCIRIWENHFRINVWIEKYCDNSVYPKYSITKSFFVFYDGWHIVDKTDNKILT
jgi:hypothetical protein